MEFTETFIYQKAFRQYLRYGGSFDAHLGATQQKTQNAFELELVELAKGLIAARINDLKRKSAASGHVLKNHIALDTTALEKEFATRYMAFVSIKGAPENERLAAEAFLRDWFAQKIDPVIQPNYGVESFTWISSSTNPCMVCASRDGQVFQWNEGIYPPGCSHCRCTAEPVFESDQQANRTRALTEQEIASTNWRLNPTKSDIRWRNQLLAGDWTKEKIVETIRYGKKHKAIYEKTGEPATRYEGINGYVVRINTTGYIIQVGRPNHIGKIYE